MVSKWDRQLFHTGCMVFFFFFCGCIGLTTFPKFFGDGFWYTPVEWLFYK